MRRSPSILATLLAAALLLGCSLLFHVHATNELPRSGAHGEAGWSAPGEQATQPRDL